MYNSNTDSLGLILDVEVFFSLGHCSGALCLVNVVHLCTPECDRASRHIQQGEGASRGLLWAP